MRLQHLTNLPSLNSKIRSFSGLFVALLLSLVMVGCGSSGGSGGGFAASPGGGGGAAGGGAAGVGTVTFNFFRPQTPIVVPTTTVNLRFRFFSALNGSGAIVLDTTRPFATTVTINNVPTTALSARVTALDANGFPLQEFSANFNVVAGGNVTLGSTNVTATAVNFTGLTANPATLFLGVTGTATITGVANFDNGDTVQVTGAPVMFGSTNNAVASVTPGGVVTAGLTGTANINMNLTVGGTAQAAIVPVTVGSGTAPPPTVTNLVINTASPQILPVGSSVALNIQATFSTSPTPVTVGAAQGVTFTTTNPDITVVNDQIVVANTATAGETSTITAFLGGRSSNQIQVQVSAAGLQSMTVTPGSVSLPFGGFETTLTIQGVFTDQSTQNIPATNVTFAGNTRFAIDPNTGKITTNAAGAAGIDNLTVTHNTAPIPPVSVQVTVGTAFVQSLTVTAVNETLPVTIVPGEVVTYTVSAQVDNGTGTISNVDVTNFAALMVSSNQAANVLATGPRAIGRAVTAVDATLTFAMNGAGPAGANVTATALVKVVANTLTSVKYFYAGNEIVANQLNLPRGYVGVFEVEGTFINGNVRKLTSAEYSIVDTGAPPLVPAAVEPAVRLFNDTFVITPVAGRYTDGLVAPGTSFVNGGMGFRVENDGTTTAFDNTRNGVGDGVDGVSDDILGTIRQTAAGAVGSNRARVATLNTFRAVAADWRQGDNLDAATAGDFQPAGTNFNAVNGFDVYNIDINNALEPVADQFTREVTVTVTNPSGNVTINSIAFLNYPTDGNIALDTPREMDIRVSFPASVAPAPANPFPNFRLAEANVLFLVDNSDPGGPDLTQFHHRPTEIGYVAVTRNVPLDIANVRVTASPLGGIAQRPVVTQGAVFTPFQAAMPPTTTMDTQPTYAEATYANITDTFGASGGASSSEGSGSSLAFDPGPGFGAEEGSDPSMLLQPTKSAAAPDDNLSISFTLFDNSGAGFEVTLPTLFTIDPGAGGGPVNIAVGATQVFRTLIQFKQNLPVVDRSLDYRPRLVNPNNTVVGETNLATGNLTVAAVLTGAGDSVQARDTTGELINQRGTFTDVLNVMGAAANTAAIVVP